MRIGIRSSNIKMYREEEPSPSCGDCSQTTMFVQLYVGALE
ncbi:MAG: hypothetical protein O7157_03520 [Wolbachia endosymbiont of Tetragnatha montana]|nr:hypothetical protein [Wolbachia endosymbiont of Tetragnatha montana]